MRKIFLATAFSCLSVFSTCYESTAREVWLRGKELRHGYQVEVLRKDIKKATSFRYQGSSLGLYFLNQDKFREVRAYRAYESNDGYIILECDWFSDFGTHNVGIFKFNPKDKRVYK
jgi:hypothetical protein